MSVTQQVSTFLHFFEVTRTHLIGSTACTVTLSVRKPDGRGRCLAKRFYKSMSEVR